MFLLNVTLGGEDSIPVGEYRFFGAQYCTMPVIVHVGWYYLASCAPRI
jgi:hypothetical protein